MSCGNPLSDPDLLKVDNLTVRFRRRGAFGPDAQSDTAIDNVSFALGRKRTLGIVGESGSGKSTLARAVLRLIEPSGGRILWKGSDFTALQGEALRLARRNMQIVFQDPLASLDPRMTVREIIERPLLNFRTSRSSVQRYRTVAEVLSLVGGDADWLGRFPHQFSGGQCQRIGIARALVLNPQLLVCDEVLSAVDVSVQAQIVSLLVGLQDAKNLSYLFISHNLAIVQRMCHGVMVLYRGRVVEYADTDKFFKRPQHPYSRALLAAVLSPDPTILHPRPALTQQERSGSEPSRMGCLFRARCPNARQLCVEVEPPLTGLPGQLVACYFPDKN
jgi:oligopeptide transport system ATP-binding protein